MIWWHRFVLRHKQEESQQDRGVVTLCQCGKIWYVEYLGRLDDSRHP